MLVIGDSADPRQWPHFAQTLHQQNKTIIELLKKQLRNQERIMAQNDEILTEVDDLQEAVAVIGGGVATLDANLTAATNRISELESAGVAPATVAALKAAVDGAQGIADRFKAAVDPSVPTPSDPAPAPVEDVATDTDAPAPADSGVVEADPATEASTPE